MNCFWHGWPWQHWKRCKFLFPLASSTPWQKQQVASPLYLLEALAQDRPKAAENRRKLENMIFHDLPTNQMTSTACKTAIPYWSAVLELHLFPGLPLPFTAAKCLRTDYLLIAKHFFDDSHVCFCVSKPRCCSTIWVRQLQPQLLLNRMLGKAFV